MDKILNILTTVISYLVMCFWLGMIVLLIPAIIPSLLVILLVETVQDKLHKK